MASESYNYKHYIHIHNVYARFIAGMGELMRMYCPRATEVVISTYGNAVQRYNTGKKDTGENWSPKFPFILVDPSSLTPEPAEGLGQMMYNYPMWDQLFAAKLYTPIYDDNNVTIYPILNRMKGNMEITIFCSSPYEVLDTNQVMVQYFGGLNKFTRPSGFKGVIIIPEEFKNYEYENTYTNDSYTLNWDDNDYTTTMLMNTTNREEFVYEFSFVPIIKLNSISDGSEKYGTEISDDKIIVSIEYEAAIPIALMLKSRNFPIPAIPLEITTNIDLFFLKTDDGGFMADKEFLSISHFGDISGSNERLHLIFDRSYNYEFTEEDITSIGNNGIITLDGILETGVYDERYIKIHGKNGFIERDEFFRLNKDSTSGSYSTIELIGGSFNSYLEGDSLTILKYKDKFVNGELNE